MQPLELRSGDSVELRSKVHVMPFESQAQRGYLYANHPEVAKEFQAATPKGAKLPEHVTKKPKTAAQNLYGK